MLCTHKGPSPGLLKTKSTLASHFSVHLQSAFVENNERAAGNEAFCHQTFMRVARRIPQSRSTLENERATEQR